MKYKNDLLIRAATGAPTERVPIWLMRQAGRILPEYRAIRNKLKSFKELVKNPELACEVTIQPVEILGVDAAIIFSDILVVPEAMGLSYRMEEGTGPSFPDTINCKKDIDKLIVANPENELSYVLKAIEITCKELNNKVPLIGFAGAPWTIFAYMIEGSGSKTFSKARKFLYTEPQLSHLLLSKITDTTIKYLQAQIQAGVGLIQLFDSWAGILPPYQYEQFAIPYIRKICDAINEVPVTVFAKGAYFAMQQLALLNCNVIGLDWNMNVKEFRNQIGQTKSLQGNLDPCLLYADKKTIESKTNQMLHDFGSERYIANLGHGLYPDTNPEKVKFFIDVVKNYKYTDISYS